MSELLYKLNFYLRISLITTTSKRRMFTVQEVPYLLETFRLKRPWQLPSSRPVRKQVNKLTSRSRLLINIDEHVIALGNL
jgi:hypothetical protein